MKLKSSIMLLALSTTSFAQTMYPAVPFKADYFAPRIREIAEDTNAVTNVFAISDAGYDIGRPTIRPWSGSYWPLNQGMIASPYQDRTFLRPWQFLTWEDNVSRFEDRKKGYLAGIDKMSADDLSYLAPSEKYDLLLGDKKFDLSTRIWSYTARWGENKMNGFLTSIEMPGPNYDIKPVSTFIALWEGICHGWATASVSVKEPVRPVTVSLPDGRRLPFYPDDIKALVSLLWANSLVQDSVFLEGNRCWVNRPPIDANGRFIDLPNKITPPGFTDVPGCGDMHPGMFHLILSNVMGKQKRGFIADINPKGQVTNQPVSSYRFYYFNPLTQTEGNIHSSVIPYMKYKGKDPFAKARTPNVEKIVGVKVEFEYADYYMPGLYDSSENGNKNKYEVLTYYYDLELDASGNIIGGQWIRKGGIVGYDTDRYMPDFLWIVPRDFKKFFRPLEIGNWDIRGGAKVPESWKNAANSAHSFIYKMTKEFGFAEKCTVINRDDKTDIKVVPCEHEYPRPQPLIQIVDQLLELSSK